MGITNSALFEFNDILNEEYSLVGQDGNAFSLIGYTARCMKECGLRDEINEMRERAMSGDYYNLIAVCDEYIQKCNEINHDIDESLNEEAQNEVFDKPGEFWYFTKHGVGPGSVPKGITIEKTIDKDGGEYFLIKDKILSTYALNKYEIKEKSPKDVDEDWKKPNGNFAGWVAIYQGKRVEIPKNEANSLYDAKLKAIEKLKVPKSKVGLLVVQPGYNESLESNNKNVDDMSFDELLELWWEMNGQWGPVDMGMEPDEIDAYFKENPDELKYNVEQGLKWYE